MDYNTLNYVIGAVALFALGATKTLRDSRSDLAHRVGELEDKNRLLVADLVLVKADNDALARHVRGDEHWKKSEEVLEQILAMLLSMRDRLPGGDVDVR